jgi:trans-2,3-dihydro-3-hydroxyanthranilate isomerase
LVTQEKQFLVVNAFAESPYGGNPAAVFTQAEGLTDGIMQAFARQLNLVESVFIFPGEGKADFRLRYFTPMTELPVAGHPTIAAWLALWHERIIDIKERTMYTQANLAGVQQIEIEEEFGNAIVTMEQPRPRFLETSCDREEVALAFGLSVSDIVPDLPIQAVDTGLGHLIVPLKSLEALMSVQRNLEPLRQLCKAAKVRETQPFCFETIEKSSHLHTRNICPKEGLEDPACGVGNGALAAYLHQFCWATQTEVNLVIEQGTAVQMPAKIHTRTIKHQDTIKGFIGGSGVVMLEGQFLV